MRHRSDERGVVAPSRVVLVGIIAVVLAAGGYFLTGSKDDSKVVVAAQPVAKQTPTPTPTPSAAPTKKAPAFTRKDTLVEVFNNSGISGLAKRTSGQAAGSGWNVIGSDNWYGTIPQTTVYYPPQLEAAAKALAKDLGVTRLMPAVSPMGFDRLTVILTADYA